jgi:hypothetical protein
MKACVTAASVAGSMLRDPRFWPARDRRKVPGATNDRARAQLPGNHYKLLALTHAGRPARVKGTVLEIDKTAAHHNAAMAQQFPASETLFAWGRFYTPVKDLARSDVIADLADVRRDHGLLLALVHGAAPPTGVCDPLCLPAAAHRGARWRHVWTNEIPLLEECGAQILGIAAGWTSNLTDEGLNEYAWHAIDVLQHATPERKGWLKQALLATYGLLAARPRAFTQLNKWGDGQMMSVTTRTGHTLHGRVRRSDEAESQTCNVIWRGLIEARVRAETISYARELRAQGQHVLSLYADAVYILKADTEPPLRPGWRVTQELTGMQWSSPTSFTSNEVVKRPGTPRRATA